MKYFEPAALPIEEGNPWRDRETPAKAFGPSLRPQRQVRRLARRQVRTRAARRMEPPRNCRTSLPAFSARLYLPKSAGLLPRLRASKTSTQEITWRRLRSFFAEAPPFDIFPFPLILTMTEALRLISRSQDRFPPRGISEEHTSELQ